LSDARLASSEHIASDTAAARAHSDVRPEVAYGDDAIARFERKIKLQQEATASAAAPLGEKVYRGTDAYSDFKKRGSARDAKAAAMASGTIGPLRAPANVRSTLVTDYQKALCKDYFETGYCGFGDTCIFLHDRSARRAGWQQENDWAERQQRRKERAARRAAGDEDVSDDSDEDLVAMAGSDGVRVGKGGAGHDDTGWRAVRDRLVRKGGAAGVRAGPMVAGAASTAFRPPEAASGETDEAGALDGPCFLCRGEMVAPVAPMCGHYMCETCALQRHRADATAGCAVCGAPTSGIFNPPARRIAVAQAVPSSNSGWEEIVD
jgi:RING finger protein 113A